VRVLLVTNYAPPNQGGVEVVVDHLAKGYQAAGHTAVVSALDLTGARGAGLPYRVEPMPGWNPLERFSVPVPLFNPITLWRRTAKLLRATDALHVHGLLYPNVLVAMILAKRRGIPVVVTEHVGLVATGNRWIDRAQAVAFHLVVRHVAGRTARAVVVLNERVYDEVARALPDHVALVRIDNGVDTDRFHPATTSERFELRTRFGFARPTVLFAGRFARKKGLDRVLDAARGGADEYDVVICGRETERLTDLPPTVRVLGTVDHDHLGELYRAADVLLLPSEGEGFPLVIQEAMASGLPVVVTPDAVPRTGPHVGVLTVAEPDGASLTAAIRALLADPGDASARGRSVAVEDFSWSTAVERYLALLSPDAATPATRAKEPT